MGVFRVLNLLQAVEGQKVSGAELESKLTSGDDYLALSAEFGSLLRTRHMSRRMAGNTVTMDAITSSAAAIRIVYENTSLYNYRPIDEITKDQSAMSTTSVILPALNALADNDVAWSYFSGSAYYEQNIMKILTTMIGKDLSLYTDLSSLLLDSSAMYDISINVRAMKALVASVPAMTIATANTGPIVDILNYDPGVNIIANSDSSMRLIASSQVALDQVTNGARDIITSVPSALAILGKNEDAWDHLMSTSTNLASNIFSLLVSFGNLDNTVFSTVQDIFDDTTASFAIANSKPAMMSIIYEPIALNKMIVSSNISNFIGSLVAITEIAASESTMNTLIDNITTFPMLLTSSYAKSAILASGPLFDNMMQTGSDSLSTVEDLAVSVSVTNNAEIGTFKSVGITGNIVVLTGVMGGAATTTLKNTFKGTSQASVEFDLTGTSASTGPSDIMLPFTNAKWDVNSVAVTPAGTVILSYVDFN
jgi:hypothetical protein